MKIITEQFSDNQYVKEISKKSQIVIHHKVSGLGINGDVAWWKLTPTGTFANYLINN
jgi:hypothetical protein